MPYRHPARPAEMIVFRGQPRITLSYAMVWIGYASAAVAVYLISDSRLARLLVVTIAVACALLVALIRRLGLGVKWCLRLELTKLRIERTFVRASELGTLDVTKGVQVAVGCSKAAGGVEPCVIVSARGRRVELCVGYRAAQVAQQIVEFLQAHDVPVTEESQ